MAEVLDPSSIPQLQGIFAPVVDEIDVGPLKVLAGALPEDLVGTYLRNGPNPRFAPLGSYTYPLDGDGMVHGLWFDGNTARYRNRFVRTPALECEERAGRALWPGVMTGEFPTAAEVGDDLAGTERDLVDIHVVRHAGRTLALAEGERPFELDDSLGTIGPYDFGGGLPSGMCAHPKVDPDTGEMVLFRYDIESEPWLTWAVVGADGTVTRPEAPIDLDGPHMIHDFVITPGHLVLFVCPLRFDLEAMLRGGSLLSWQPGAGTRIAVVDRTSGTVTWFDDEAFWVWHFANATEHDRPGGGTVISVDFPWWSHPGMGLGSGAPEAGIVRAQLDLDRRRVSFDDLFDDMTEFPRIDDRRTGKAHRWFCVAGKDPDVPPEIGAWNRLLRFDTGAGAIQDRRGGRTRFGEAVFAPRVGGTAEDDGYLLTFAFDADTLETTFLVLDAADIEADPVAVLAMPQRVPFGLHGSWLPAA